MKRTRILMALAAATAGLGVGSLALPSGAHANYYYCYAWPLSPGEVCRNPNPEYVMSHSAHSYNNERRVCINLQYWSGGTYNNYYPWQCGVSGVGSPTQQYYYGQRGFAVVKNGHSGGGVFTFYGWVTI